MTGGFYAWSGNAMPMPKIQLGTRDYLNFAKGWLGVHMTYSHGWFDNQGPTINGYLHQKTLYGRLGKINSTINLFGGINHNVDWGGESKVKKGGDFDYYPSGLNTYFYVVTVLKDRTIIATDPNSSWDDLGYQFGNHLGSIDLALKFQNNYFDLLLYRQSMYETGRIASLAIINDGLNGISLKLKKNNLVKNIGLEYLYTANQGNYTSGISSYLGIIDSHKIEIETYMNNGARGSWKYWNKTLGTPIFILESDRGPKYTGKNFGLTAIKSFHFYVSGEVTKTLFWQIRTSLGSYASARNHLMPRLAKEDFISQNSVYLGLEKKINQRIQSKINFSFDSGKMIRNSSGFSLSVKYIFPNGKM
jgi:hypothetical protein